MIPLIATAIYYMLDILVYAIFIYVILSWVPNGRNSKFGYLLARFIEPVLGPIRNLFQRRSSATMMPIDFSPLIALLLIRVLRGIIRPYIMRGGIF
jgi:YggT family protein